MCLTRVKHSGTIVSPVSIGICLLECFVANEDGVRVDIDLLNAEFFDDETIVIVYRLRDQGAFISVHVYAWLVLIGNLQRVPLLARSDSLIWGTRDWTKTEMERCVGVKF